MVLLMVHIKEENMENLIIEILLHFYLHLDNIYQKKWNKIYYGINIH